VGTVIAQTAIIQWGGVVFRIDNGLSFQNWVISICIGSGSLFVGYFLRCLPDPQNIPPWMLGAGFTAKDPKAAIQEEMKSKQPKGPSEMGAKWSHAIHQTRVQIRVTRLFRQRRDSASIVMVDRPGLRQAQVQLQKTKI
jgi:hypothetical protein